MGWQKRRPSKLTDIIFWLTILGSTLLLLWCVGTFIWEVAQEVPLK